MKYTVRVPGREYQVEIAGDGPGYRITIDGRSFEVNASNLGDEALAHTRVADARRGLIDVSIAGKYRRVEVLDELAAARAHAADKDHQGRFVLEAPMPGLVVDLRVKPGDTVQAGQPLVVMEAMKMQNELVSEAPGVVREVRVRLQQAVESGTELVVIESS
jgi:biotin carboxyl carrier protein